MNDANLKSPQSEWKRETLADVIGSDGLFVDGDWVESKDQDPDGDVRLVQLADIGDGEYRDRSSRFLTSEKARLLKCSFIQPGDVLIARMPDPLGRACIFPGDKKRAVTVVDVAIVRVRNSDVDPRWLMYCVNSPFFRRAVSDLQSGSTRQRISRKNLSTIDFLRPSHDEQLRVVAEIEKQFSRLDEAVANLKRVKANLKRFKAAVLKAAFGGRLVTTEDEIARKQCLPYETGTELVRRMLNTRRDLWRGKGEYTEQVAPNIANLPTLPEGWAWARLDAIALLKGGITVDKGRIDSTARRVPYLRVANVQRGFLDLSEVKYISAPAADIEQLRLLKGDILFNEGGDRDKLGRGWIWEGQLPDCIHQNHVFRARLLSTGIHPKFVSWWGNSFGKTYFSREGKQTTNLASINITKLSGFPVPIPPSEEQSRIVAEVECRFTVAESIEAQVESNLKRAERMRDSILSKAFGVCAPRSRR